MKNRIFIALAATLMSLSALAQTSDSPCNWENQGKEIKEMKMSPYWQKHFQTFSKWMNEKRVRGCSDAENQRMEYGLFILSDDLEFVTNHQFLGSLGTYNSTPVTKDGLFEVMGRHEPFLQGVSSVTIRGEGGSFVFPVNHCSPKVIFAHLMAVTPYVFSAHCYPGFQDETSNQKIVNEAQKILEAEKVQ